MSRKIECESAASVSQVDTLNRSRQADAGIRPPAPPFFLTRELRWELPRTWYKVSDFLAL